MALEMLVKFQGELMLLCLCAVVSNTYGLDFQIK